MSYINHPNITRKLLTAFLEYFSYIELERYSNGFTQRKIQKVPIQYCATDKWFQIVNSSSARKNMNLDANIAPVEMQWILPRLSVNLVNIVYDNDRHINKGQIITLDNGTRVNAPVPYNLEIELSSISKNLDDAFQIMEQILPFFTPTLSINVKISDNITDSVAIGLNTTSFDFPTEVAEADERLFIVTYGFTMRSNYYFQRTETSKQIFNTGFSITVNDTGALAIDSSETLFAQFLSNASNPNPINQSTSFKDTDQVTLKDKGEWNALSTYKNFEYARYGTNKFIWIGGTLPNIEPNTKGWEKCWTLLSVIQNTSFNVFVDENIREEFIQ